MYNRIINFFRYLFKKKYEILFSDDIPLIIPEDVIYISDKRDPWVLSLKCPCGCNDDVHLNLLPGASPKWTFTIKRSKLTVFPSVHRIKGCRSHFWIEKSKIYWWYESK